MATDPRTAYALDWSAGTREKCYFDALKDLFSQYIGCDDEDDVLSEDDHRDIMARWRKRYKDTYDLFIDNDDDIQPLFVNYDTTQDAKVILLRCMNDRWEAYCHFEGAKNSAHNPLPPILNVAMISLCDRIDRTRVATPLKVSGRVNNGEDATTDTSGHDDSLNEKLVETLERLISSVEDLAAAVKTRSISETNLCTAMDKLSASLNKTTQAQTQTQIQAQVHDPLAQATKDHGIDINTDHDHAVNALNVYLSEQQNFSQLGDMDDSDLSTLYSDTTDYTPNASEILQSTQPQ